METLGSYLLQMACWLAGFWLVYAAFLKKETFFELNRWFLLVGLLASLLLPLFPVRYNVVVQPSDLSVLKLFGVTTQEIDQSVSKLNYWAIAYVLGVTLFLIRFAWQSAKLYRMRRQCERVTIGETQIFKLEKDTTPFSFFNSIYVSKKMCGETELKTVVAHEKVHIDERHWVDLLLLEVARTLQWFNPLLILYRKAIMQNHEFLADYGTLQKGVSARTYKAILANQMLGVTVLQVANGFTLYNPTKRIIMMNKDKTKPTKRLKLLWTLPVIAILLVAFSKPNYVSGENAIVSNVANEKSITVKGKVTDENGNPLQGTSIIVSNTTTGTMPDAKGNYTLAGIKPDAEIVFSFVGYETKVAKATSKLNVTLMREIVHIGYAKEQMAPPPPPPPPLPPPPPPTFDMDGKDAQKPLVDIDGKTTTVDINDIDSSTIEKIEVLKDQSATYEYCDKSKKGIVIITTKKEMTPSPASIEISKWSDKVPLIIIDGVISTIDMKNFDPSSIQSLEVLKDKAAIEIYGEKGKNGVILITSKKEMASPPPPPAPFALRGMEGQKSLVVVDGKITSTNINAIDPQTIGKIIVLKGKSATEIYGKKGKDGVILVTTKKEMAPPPPPPPPADEEVFVVVEEMPEFPGGLKALSKYITQKTSEVNEIGFAEVRFLVDIDGQVKDVKAVSTESEKLNKLAIEIISGLSRWKPGIQRGKAVPVSMQLGIDFGTKSIVTNPKSGNKK